MSAKPWAISNEWMLVAEELQLLTEELCAWSSLVLIPLPSGEALKCVAHFQLPDDWAAMEHRLDSGGMNARAFTTKSEVIDNDGQFLAPPTDEPMSEHLITSSAVVLVNGIGTLEVLANTEGYRFGEKQLQKMRDVAKRIAEIVGTF